jgi:hypothetical protein
MHRGCLAAAVGTSGNDEDDDDDGDAWFLEDVFVEAACLKLL